MNKINSPEPNPALQNLEVLAGDWKMELSNASFLPSPSDTITGQVSFEWVQGGAFRVMYMGNHPSQAPDATWLMGRDEASHNYTVLYYDARKVSRIYNMSFSDGTWKMWRNASGFSQRFEGTLNADGSAISARWEKSFDGENWEHDFNVTYTRVR